MLNTKFNHIKTIIIESIQNSKIDIKIAVAWFTSPEIQREIIERLSAGIKIHVIISDDILNRLFNKKAFESSGGLLTVISSKQNKFLHEKFAIFDSKLIITGSYNYTRKAEYYNYESVIISDSEALIKSYNYRFDQILVNANQSGESQFTSLESSGVIDCEKNLQTLEEELNKELLESIAECYKRNIQLDYSLVYQLIERYGPIGAPKRLILTGISKIQSGFKKLFEAKLLRLSFEAIIVQEKYRILFEESVIFEAEKRLKEFKYLI